MSTEKKMSMTLSEMMRDSNITVDSLWESLHEADVEGSGDLPDYKKWKEEQTFETVDLAEDQEFSTDSLLPGIKGAPISSDGKPLFASRHPHSGDRANDLSEDCLDRAIEDLEKFKIEGCPIEFSSQIEFEGCAERRRFIMSLAAEKMKDCSVEELEAVFLNDYRF